MKKSLEELNKEIETFFRQLPQLENKVAEAVNLLFQMNWYLPVLLQMPGFMIYLSEEIQKGNLNNIEEKLLQYYSTEYDYLTNRILNQFPYRRFPLEAAFDAQRKKLYFLSIPVFYCQIEGIFKEITSIRYFKLDKKFIIKQIENLDITESIKKYLFPVTKTSEFDRLQIENNPSGLNRHDVLHGDSNDYGTEINSFKVFSLLTYVSDVVYYSKTKFK